MKWTWDELGYFLCNIVGIVNSVNVLFTCDS